MNVRSLEELRDVSEPAWPHLESLVAAAPGASVIACERASGERALAAIQVTAASTLGALALNTGGILADNAWFKILGAGGLGLPSLAEANGLGGPGGAPATPGSFVVAYDAIGGVFAIDGGALGVASGEVCYFGPDTLAWSGLGGGHTAFVTAAINGGLSETFASLRWPGWENTVGALAPSEAVFLYPPPFSAEGQDHSRVARSVVPLDEAVAFYSDFAAQLDRGK